MNATKRRKAVPVMQNYLRFLITGAPAQWSEAKATTADYRQWAWHVHHKGALRVCAVLSVVIMFLYLRAIEDTPLKLQICGMILLAVFMAVLTVNRLPLPAPAAANWARQAIMLFSVLQCMVTINVAVGARTPGRSLILFCPWWLDVATNLVVDVPCLALGDMRVKSWLVFLCMHVAVGVPFYVSVQGYNLPLAIFKAAVIQGLSLIAYTAIERPMCTTYMRHFAETSRQGGAALEGSLWSSNEQEHQEQQKSEGHRRLAMWVAGSSKSADPPPPRFQCKVWSSDPEPLSPSNVSSCSPCKAAAEQPAVGPADVQEGHGDLPGCFAKGSANVQEEHAGGSAGLQEGHGEGHDDVLVGQKEGYGDVQHTGACVELAAAEAAQLPTGWALDLPQKGPVDLAHRGAKNPADLARRAAGTPDAWSADKRQYVSNLRRSTVSIKLRSSFGPEKLSPEAPSRLTQRVASSFPGMMVVDVAVRRGCIVLSMDVCELQRIAQQKGEGQAHGLSQDEMMQEIIRQWLLSSGLQDLLVDGTALAVQVDGSVLKCTWNRQAQSWEFSTECMSFNRDLFSIMVPDFILLFPSETSLLEDHHHHHHHQQQQQQQQQQLTFKAYISAPSEFQLIGWHESMVGQTQDRAQGDTLQLLAHSQGRFLAIEILHLGDRDESGGQSVLACVSLPLDMAAFECCQLRLELMRDDALLCNYNTMLVRSDLYPEVQDVKGWAKPPRTPAQISAFIEDLAEYLSFQSLLHHAGKHAPALLDSVGMTPGRSAGRASNWDSLLPVLLAETCRPEMLQMMAEVGMDLLQHAVSWGMVHLAERILSGMLAPPLNIPFATIASGTLSADCDTACPPARQSLLSYALMSEDVVMFERMLGWGHLYGGPTFTWELDGSGVGSDPQLARMVQALPSPQDHLAHSHAATLHQLLGVGAPAAAAEVQRAWGAKHGDAGALQLPLRQRQLSGGQTVGSPSSACATAAATASPSSAAASATPPNSVVAPSGMVSSSSSSATPSSGPSRTPSFAQGLLPPSVSHGYALVSVARALAMGFGEHGDIKESQYRAWCKACCVGLANKVCIGVVPFFWLQAALSLSRGLYKSAFTLALYPVPMFLALITKNRKKREACMFWAKIFHLCYYIIFGLGLMPTIVARKLAITHLDFIVEVILCRLLWQVQLRALLVERAASTIGSSMLYSRLQFQHPLLQALAINFASVCVGMALDVRNRRMYVHLVRARALLSQRGKKVQ